MKWKSIYEQKEFHTEQLVNNEYERTWSKYHFIIKHHYSCFTDRNPEAERIPGPHFLIKWLCMHQVSDHTESETAAAALASSLPDYLLHTFFFLPVSTKRRMWDWTYSSTSPQEKTDLWCIMNLFYLCILVNCYFIINIYRCSQHYPSAINSVDGAADFASMNECKC